MHIKKYSMNLKKQTKKQNEPQLFVAYSTHQIQEKNSLTHTHKEKSGLMLERNCSAKQAHAAGPFIEEVAIPLSMRSNNSQPWFGVTSELIG